MNTKITQAILEKLNIETKQCCKDRDLALTKHPTLPYGYDFLGDWGLRCNSCKREVRAETLEMLIIKWNQLFVLDKLAADVFIKTANDKDRELPYMELVAW